jgi:hypothetical protein
VAFEFFFESPRPPDTVVVHNDDRTVWAYLRTPDGIVGDVWLFNLEAAPDEIAPERGRPPLNAARYCSPEAPPVIEGPDDLALRWVYEEERLVAVEIVVEDRALARLAPGAKPGWSRFAAVDGPCARTMG